MSENCILSPINRSVFLMRSVYTQNFEHLNKVGIWATMDSKLEEQRAVIKFLLLEGERPCQFFQRLQTSFCKACISPSTFYSWDSQCREVRATLKDKPRPGRPTKAVTPTFVANVEVFFFFFFFFCQQR